MAGLIIKYRFIESPVLVIVVEVSKFSIIKVKIILIEGRRLLSTGSGNLRIGSRNNTASHGKWLLLGLWLSTVSLSWCSLILARDITRIVRNTRRCRSDRACHHRRQ